ncbi:hypothetical protein EJ03DRAFT_323986 [Teratosphaeria nubilosa]|uniref:Proline-rich protein RiP-15 n=1 Tax=Teratosphaeria nubilosa TaxID=161662 RepID=A0A6G1LKH5_9PEZI|nr:hypothetical protein EJ03DRAFT_323986 [Teratosphaeria nubilosa]
MDSNDQPPPPPPPHGQNPRPPGTGSGLPDGNYDIFIIPPHSAGSGFLYLPSMQPHRNSFLLGVASTLLTIGVWTLVVPVLKQWLATVMASGGAGVLALMVGVGVAAWAFGKTQGEWEGSGRRPGAGGAGAGQEGPRGYKSYSSGPHANGWAPPPRSGEHSSSPPPPPPTPPPPPPQPEPQAQPQQQPKTEAPPPPPPEQKTAGASPPMPDPPKPEPPKPDPPKPDPPKPDPPKPDPPKPDPPKPQARTASSWEKAREETRRREEERKRAEELAKKRAEAQKLREEAEKAARAKAEKEKWEQARAREKEQREREARERIARERLAREKEARERETREREAREAREKAATATPPRTPTKPATTRTTPSTKYEKPTAASFLGSDAASHSFRPYDTPPSAKRSAYTTASSVSGISESSYAPSMSTARTTPPPSMRGSYSTKDPDKIQIKGVYMFSDSFPMRPIAQLEANTGLVTDGLVLRIKSEGLFIDDDMRGVAQREWDVKAWTLKLVEDGSFKAGPGEELHVLRATARDAENKRYTFVLDESESWKVAVGLQKLRKGSQVRSLGMNGMKESEAKNVLALLGYL